MLGTMNSLLGQFDMLTWLFQNLLWLFLLSVVFLGGIKGLTSIIGAWKISRAILKDNRDTRGNGLGKYSADRFIQVWFSKPKLPLRYEIGVDFPLKFGVNSRHWMNVIDDELERMGLVQVYDDRTKGYKVVKPIINFRNRCVLRMTIFSLIHCVGDSRQYYSDLKK